MKQWAKNKNGFTIVELLIVIVVIGILAAITVVAYNGIQQRARDSQRKSNLTQIAKLIQVRAIDYSTVLRSGDSCTTNSTGFFSQAGISLTGSNYGAKSAAQCLAQESNSKVVFVDPSDATSCVGSNPDGCFTYLFYNCTGRVSIYAHLESETTTTNAVDGSCESTYDTSWGMNYYVDVAI